MSVLTIALDPTAPAVFTHTRTSDKTLQPISEQLSVNTKKDKYVNKFDVTGQGYSGLNKSCRNIEIQGRQTDYVHNNHSYHSWVRHSAKRPDFPQHNSVTPHVRFVGKFLEKTSDSEEQIHTLHHNSLPLHPWTVFL